MNRKIGLRASTYRLRWSPWDQIRLGTSIIIVALLIGGSYLVFFHSSRFYLKNIEAKGQLKHVSPGEIREMMSPHLGRNLLTMSLFRVARDIQEHPWIRHATLRRKFPDRLEVYVEEQQAAAFLKLGSEAFLINGAGLVFKKATADETAGLPAIEGFEREKLQKHPRYFKPLLVESVMFLFRLQEKLGGQNARIARIRRHPTEGLSADVCFTTRPGGPCGTVFFGVGNLDLKISEWHRFLAESNSNDIWFRSMDFHVEGKIFARLSPVHQQGEKNGP